MPRLMPNNSDFTLSDAVQEVIAWSSIFNYHPTLDDLIQNLRIKSTEEEISRYIQSTESLKIEDENNLSFIFQKIMTC